MFYGNNVNTVDTCGLADDACEPNQRNGRTRSQRSLSMPAAMTKKPGAACESPTDFVLLLALRIAHAKRSPPAVRDHLELRAVDSSRGGR